MPIANTGPMGISTIKSFWGAGANGIGAYYRGGGIVPSQRPGVLTPGNTVPGNTVPGTPAGCNSNGRPKQEAPTPVQIYVDGNTGEYVARIYWGNRWCNAGKNSWPDKTAAYRNLNPYGCCYGSWNANSIQGTGPKSNPAKESGGWNPPGGNPPTQNPPTTNPPTQTDPVQINLGIPTIGPIGLSNFYGGEK
jgi:hypothetical protein